MGDKEFILSGFEAPSSDLNNLIHDFKLDKWPNIEPTLQTNDVVHTTSLNYATGTNGTSENELTTNVIYEPKVEVVLEQRMVRFRYDSELNNRNFGKEVLAKIVIRNYVGKVKIRIHAVDDKRMKAHPFCLIGDKCNSGVYLEEHDVSTDKTDCICKATPRIPKQKEYETELQKRKTEVFDVKKFPYITADMSKDDYWTSNKGMKESKEIILMVEVLFVDANNQYIAIQSEPISNAKDGKKFEVHAVSPTTSSVSGSQNDPHFIILTGDSYSPNESDIVIRFHDDGDWKEEIRGKVIKNAIEFHFPGYRDSISVPKTVYVTVYDKKRKIETSRKPIILQPTDNDILESKRRKAQTHFTIPDLTLKTEDRGSCSGGRKIHHLKRRGGANKGADNSPLNLNDLEEQGVISLNICSPPNFDVTSTSGPPINTIPISSYNDPGKTDIPMTISALLAPSGATLSSQHAVGQSQSHGISTTVTVCQSQSLGNNMTLAAGQSQSLENNTAVTQRMMDTDLSQEQTLSLSQLQNILQYPDVLRVLGLTSEGQVPQPSYDQGRNEDYDPHNVRLEDLLAENEIGEHDIEIDGSKISSSTENECEHVGQEADSNSVRQEADSTGDRQKADSNGDQQEADSNGDQQEADSTDKCDSCNNCETSETDSTVKKLSEITVNKKTVEDISGNNDVQSDVVSSNVDSDVEEG